jgi:hypothetical protein
MNSRGWVVVQEILKGIVADFTAEAMDCDDDSMIVSRQRKAHAARKVVEEFNRRAAAGTNIDQETHASQSDY